MSSAAVLAGRWRRLLATAIDATLVPMLTILLVMMTGVVEDAEDYADSMWVVWVLLLAVFSYLLLNSWGLWRRGQTIGKRLMGIAIVAADTYDRAPLWRLLLIRAWFFPLLFLIPLLAIVPWVALLPVLDQLLIFRRPRRCLHDLLAGTTVVRMPVTPKPVRVSL